MGRLQREAEVLASLNHPNIATIYGFKKAEGVHFLALELVEGETLAERVATGPLLVVHTLHLQARGRLIFNCLHVSKAFNMRRNQVFDAVIVDATCQTGKVNEWAKTIPGAGRDGWSI